MESVSIIWREKL